MKRDDLRTDLYQPNRCEQRRRRKIKPAPPDLESKDDAESG